MQNGFRKLKIKYWISLPKSKHKRRGHYKIQNAIKEVSKGECIIMGYFNYGHLQRKSLESTGCEDQQFLFLIQDSFLSQHVLEPTRGDTVLDIVLSSQKELHCCVVQHDIYTVV